MSNRMRVWIPTIAIILVLTVSLWGLWIWNDQRHLNDPHRVEKLLSKGYVIKSSYPNGTLVLERRLHDGTIKRRTIMPTASTIIPASGAANGHHHSTTTSTGAHPGQHVSSYKEKKITITPHAHGAYDSHPRTCHHHQVKPRKSRVRKFFHDVKKVLSGGTGHKHDTVVGSTMVGNKKITCKVNCEAHIVKRPAAHNSSHNSCHPCCDPCCNGQSACQCHPTPAAAHHDHAAVHPSHPHQEHAAVHPCHSHQQQQHHAPPVQTPIASSHPNDCHSHSHTHSSTIHHGGDSHPSVAHPVVKLRVYHEGGLKVRVYKHKFHDLHGREHTVHAHTTKHDHPTHVQHQISLQKHQVAPNTSYNPIIPAGSSHASHHLYVPSHVSQHNEYYFKGTKGVKHLGRRKRNGIEYDCWGNVPQTVAFSPQYYGHHKNILIEVPKDKKGHKLPVTSKTMVTFCVRVTK